MAIGDAIGDFEPDREITVYVDPSRLMVFDQAGRAMTANLKQAA